jgi:hypothetical protein
MGIMQNTGVLDSNGADPASCPSFCDDFEDQLHLAVDSKLTEIYFKDLNSDFKGSS